MPKIPEARHWALRLANEWRSSSTTAGPPPPPSTAGFSPQAGFSVTGSLVEGGSIAVTRAGGGFGASGPDVVMYADWHTGGTLNSPIPTSDTVIGSWTDSPNSPIYRPGRDGGFSMGVRSPTLLPTTGQFRLQNLPQFSEWFQSYALHLGSQFGSPTAGQIGPSNFKKIWQASNATFNAANNNSDRYWGHGGYAPGTRNAQATTATTVTLAAADVQNDTYVGRYLILWDEDRRWRQITAHSAGVVTVSPAFDPAPVSQTGRYVVASGDVNLDNNLAANSGGIAYFTRPTKSQVVFNGWQHYQEYCRANLDTPYTASSHAWSAITNANFALLSSTDSLSMFTSPDNTWYNTINVPGFIGNFFLTEEGLDIRFDDLYLAVGPGACKRFILSDSPELTTARETYICPHSQWADGQASITLPYLESLSFVGKHLIFFNESNAPTYVGEFV